jgi:hypothetical protein
LEHGGTWKKDSYCPIGFHTGVIGASSCSEIKNSQLKMTLFHP